MSKQIQKRVNRSWSGLVQFPEREALNQTWGAINCVQRWVSQPHLSQWGSELSPSSHEMSLLLFIPGRECISRQHTSVPVSELQTRMILWDMIIATLSWWPLWVLPMSLLRYFSLHLSCQLLLVPQLGCCYHCNLAGPPRTVPFTQEHLLSHHSFPWILDAHLGQCPHMGAPNCRTLPWTHMIFCSKNNSHA